MGGGRLVRKPLTALFDLFGTFKARYFPRIDSADKISYLRAGGRQTSRVAPHLSQTRTPVEQRTENGAGSEQIGTHPGWKFLSGASGGQEVGKRELSKSKQAA